MQEVIDKGRCTAAHPVPLLFVHGGWHAAWCWDEHFLDFFAENGFQAAAVSVRAHGLSATSQRLRTCSITDYVDDVKAAAALFGSGPVLVGHSMGGFIVQKLLEIHHAPAAVLIAATPPNGALRAWLRLIARHPWAALLRPPTIGNTLDMMLEPGWQAVAERIVQWLGHRGL